MYYNGTKTVHGYIGVFIKSIKFHEIYRICIVANMNLFDHAEYKKNKKNVLIGDVNLDLIQSLCKKKTKTKSINIEIATKKKYFLVNFFFMRIEKD